MDIMVMVLVSQFVVLELECFRGLLIPILTSNQLNEKPEAGSDYPRPPSGRKMEFFQPNMQQIQRSRSPLKFSLKLRPLVWQ